MNIINHLIGQSSSCDKNKSSPWSPLLSLHWESWESWVCCFTEGKMTYARPTEAQMMSSTHYDIFLTNTNSFKYGDILSQSWSCTHKKMMYHPKIALVLVVLQVSVCFSIQETPHLTFIAHEHHLHFSGVLYTCIEW